MNPGTWGLLAIGALGFVALFGSFAFIYTVRLQRLPAIPGSDKLNGYQATLRKLRKAEPMTQDQHNLAKRIIDIRRHPMAYTIPAAFMSVGIFYVLGSLEYLHGAHPSERTFLGVIPMFTSTNLIIQMRKTARVKKRLPKAALIERQNDRTDPVAAPATGSG